LFESRTRAARKVEFRSAGRVEEGSGRPGSSTRHRSASTDAPYHWPDPSAAGTSSTTGIASKDNQTPTNSKAVVLRPDPAGMRCRNEARQRSTIPLTKYWRSEVYLRPGTAGIASTARII